LCATKFGVKILRSRWSLYVLCTSCGGKSHIFPFCHWGHRDHSST